MAAWVVPLAIAAIKAGSSIYSGLSSASQARKSQQETNEMNYRIFKEQNAFNLDMWNKTNEYNSAKNQVKRLSEAGLNPYLMMSGGDAGTASSLTSAAATPMQSPSEQAFYNPVGDAVNGGIDRYMNAASQLAAMDYQESQKQNIEAQTEFQKVKNLFALDNELLDLANKTQDARQKKWINDQRDRLKDVLDQAIINQTDLSSFAVKKEKSYSKYYDEAAELSIKEARESLNILIKSGLVKGQELKNLKRAYDALGVQIEGYRIDNEGKRIDNTNKKKQGQLLDVNITSEQLKNCLSALDYDERMKLSDLVVEKAKRDNVPTSIQENYQDMILHPDKYDWYQQGGYGVLEFVREVWSEVGAPIKGVFSFGK